MPRAPSNSPVYKGAQSRLFETCQSRPDGQPGRSSDVPAPDGLTGSHLPPSGDVRRQRHPIDLSEVEFSVGTHSPCGNLPVRVWKAPTSLLAQTILAVTILCVRKVVGKYAEPTWIYPDGPDGLTQSDDDGPATLRVKPAPLASAGPVPPARPPTRWPPAPGPYCSRKPQASSRWQLVHRIGVSTSPVERRFGHSRSARVGTGNSRTCLGSASRSARSF